MTAVRKLTLGIQPENKAFRITSMWGLIVDAVTEARGKVLSETYYTNISETQHNGFISMTNEKEGNTLYVDRQNISFTKSAYPSSHVDLDDAFQDFLKVWKVIQNVIDLKSIRRIGLVGEHRVDAQKSGNVDLLDKLTSLRGKDHPAKFLLHYENRVPSLGDVVDERKGSYTNSIYDFYDSSGDQQFPADGKINANFDYQRYYAPSLTKKFPEEMQKHFWEYKKERIKFELELVRLGLAL